MIKTTLKPRKINSSYKYINFCFIIFSVVLSMKYFSIKFGYIVIYNIITAIFVTENIIPEHRRYLGISYNFRIAYCNDIHHIQIRPKKVKHYFLFGNDSHKSYILWEKLYIK